MKKLLIIFSGLAVICGLELSGINAKYVDEVQQYLKVVIATYLASDSTADILAAIKEILSNKHVNSKNSPT